MAATRSSVDYSGLKTLKVTVDNRGIARVDLNRGKRMNALNKDVFADLQTCFGELLDKDADVRVAVLCGGDCKMFCSGIDLEYLQSVGAGGETSDTGRKAIALINNIKFMQQAFHSITRCSKPVIGAAYKMCIGAGLELLAACDVRLATKDTMFSIREPRLGLAADLGALQRIPKACGNQSLVTSLALTGKDFTAEFAEQKLGFCETYDALDKTQIEQKAFLLAAEIAAISPVAVWATKKVLGYSREKTIEEGLEYVRNMNGGVLQTEDTMVSVAAQMSKTKPEYAKL